MREQSSDSQSCSSPWNESKVDDRQSELLSVHIQYFLVPSLSHIKFEDNSCCLDQSSNNFPSKEVRLSQSFALRGEMAQKEVRLDRETLVRSVWIPWRICWLFLVEAATAWTVLKITGTEKMRRISTAALSVERPLYRGLSRLKTPC